MQMDLDESGIQDGSLTIDATTRATMMTMARTTQHVPSRHDLKKRATTKERAKHV